jgi:xanthine dehydrogenase YagS FAD-binding subunit
VGAVAARPLRLEAVERAITGKPLNEDTAKMAGELAIEGAFPLRHNGYKVPLMRNLVRRAVRGGPLAGATT